MDLPPSKLTLKSMLDLIEAFKTCFWQFYLTLNCSLTEDFPLIQSSFQLQPSEANLKQTLPSLEKSYVQLNTFNISLKRAQNKEKTPA